MMAAWAQYIVRVILAGLFIYAGTIKFLQPDIFLSDIESYRMMPYALAWLVTFYLPPLEILCGLGLLLPKFRKPSGYLLLLLMLVFIITISVAWARGLNISCGCFGTSEEATNYIWLIVRDLLISGALLFSIKFINFNEQMETN
ncbi:MauE/DoxX family redox-associated membrane protein [Coraliomargarita sp. SDUM461004]|uniref:MauE/DoxX family redox-associated membrane protein n=1 Tax=Thalassobacterium sedimentorum TaxID=3041258 RepID=A0ABU1AN83_9BACT|nr:MauE/DoxX family redox-associated membrane protein [Coraliomargarita sp. SDUM461004]MDQ8196261.1 MauE/DoxX family redox-associated membrane protein [Coraliomargarita sp. SDUM461004]